MYSKRFYLFSKISFWYISTDDNIGAFFASLDGADIKHFGDRTIRDNAVKTFGVKDLHGENKFLPDIR